MSSNTRRKRKLGPSTVQLGLDALEIARGHDGLLRGHPEPVVVLCVYAVGAGGATCVLRHVERFLVKRPPPTIVAPREKAALRHRFTDPKSPCVLVVAAALDEDRGDGVEEVFARMGEPEELSLFTLGEIIPEPRPAHTAALALVEQTGVHEVQLLFGRELASRAVGGDEWIGACALATRRAKRVRERLRLPFRAKDERNDWTLVLDVQA